jgi:hypothetical protein
LQAPQLFEALVLSEVGTAVAALQSAIQANTRLGYGPAMSASDPKRTFDLLIPQGHSIEPEAAFDLDQHASGPESQASQ